MTTRNPRCLYLALTAAAFLGAFPPMESRGQSLFDRPVGMPPSAPSPAATTPDPAQPADQHPSSAPAGEPGQPAPANSPAPAAPSAFPGQGVPGAAPMPGATSERGEDEATATARRAAMALDGYSLMVVVPPKPRTFQKHDLIEIIINENTDQKFEQNLKTDKKYDIKASLKKFPSLQSLLEGQIRNGDSQATADLDVGSNSKHEGDGEYERKDKFTARIAAEVVDVKPNGNLVLEARKSIDSNRESTLMVLSGVCRGQDITRSNTIQSSQLANLTLKTENDGDVKDAARKGLIPRVLETLFNF